MELEFLEKKKFQWYARYLSARYIVSFAYSRGDPVSVMGIE